MEANAVDSATQTSDLESGDEPYASARVGIDTSVPFHSVEEAVIRFGGRGFWIPGSTHEQETEVSDINKLEERTVAMLKELQLKEKETNEVLQELDITKRLVEDLKLKLWNESPDTVGDSKKDVDYSISNQMYKPEEDSDVCVTSVTGLIMSELKQAKLSLRQNTNELAEICASVESLSKKIEKENREGRLYVNPLVISKELRELNYEADQFMKTAESAKTEVQRAMSEIDQTKTSLKVVELRWLTAKKLEEAARDLSSHNERVADKTVRMSLSVEEYCALTDRAKKASRLLKTDLFDPFRKIKGGPRRDSRILDSRPRTRPTTSIGDILSMKQVVEEGGAGAIRRRVSLNQMLNRHRREDSSQRQRETNEGGEPKRLLSKRKGLGLVHISFPLLKHG